MRQLNTLVLRNQEVSKCHTEENEVNDVCGSTGFELINKYEIDVELSCCQKIVCRKFSSVSNIILKTSLYRSDQVSSL